MRGWEWELRPNASPSCLLERGMWGQTGALVGEASPAAGFRCGQGGRSYYVTPTMH